MDFAAGKKVKVKRTQCILYMMPETAKKLVPFLLEDTENLDRNPGRPRAMWVGWKMLYSTYISHKSSFKLLFLHSPFPTWLLKKKRCNRRCTLSLQMPPFFNCFQVLTSLCFHDFFCLCICVCWCVCKYVYTHVEVKGQLQVLFSWAPYSLWFCFFAFLRLRFTCFG